MPYVPKSSTVGYVRKNSISRIDKKMITAANCCDVQICIAVIVCVSKGGRYADFVREANTGRVSNVLELPVAEVSPEFV